MSNEPNESNEVFEIGRIRQLIELLREFDLSEIDLRDAAQRIRIRRGGNTIVSSHPIAPPHATAASTTTAAKPEDDKHTSFIKSPMVGSFYSRPKPDQPPFVKVGDVVSAETIVCIVEAMKMFNEIPAGVAGKIVEVCVKEGEAVDVNKPLFKLAI
jgi:acetyl-CoA carboxylase biotin carboxyl carrier protein